MDLIRIYQCLCDRTRLRILHLLQRGPLCVCHLQKILGEPQVKVSKHLRYLKTHQMVQMRKVGNWRIYQLPPRPPAELASNLRCLQDCVAEDLAFLRDRAKLQKMRGCLAAGKPAGLRPRASVQTAGNHGC